MTLDADADEEDQDFAEDEAEVADFEGGPTVGRTKLTEEDFSSVWFALPQNRNIVVRFAFIPFAIPLFWFVSSKLNTVDTANPLEVPWLAFAVPILIGGALVYGMWRGRGVWARNAVADMRGAEGVEYRFDALGFSLKSPGRQFQLAWSTLYRSIETANAFAIYTAPAMVTVVPKRAFSAEEQVRLRARLLEHVPNRQLRGTGGWRTGGRMLLVWAALLAIFLTMWQFLGAK